MPNSFHYEWVIKSIKKGKNILVEKPATINFLQMENIKNNLKDKNIFFSEAFMYRYHPQITKVIDLIKISHKAIIKPDAEKEKPSIDANLSGTIENPVIICIHKFNNLIKE